MSEVTFVTRGFGKQPETILLLAGLIGLRHSFCPQGDEVIRRFADGWHQRVEKLPVAALTEHLADSPNELAVAVMFHQPIDSIAIHHARNEAVVALELRIPDHKLAQRLRQSGLRKSGTHDHAIAHPGSGVAPRTRLDGRAIAVDQNVPSRRAEAIKGRSRTGRHLPLHVAQRRAPPVERLAQPGGRRPFDFIEIGD